ncbi:MAG: uL15m family ribosomal protein [Candidatus Woesearchaeota archaeon]
MVVRKQKKNRAMRGDTTRGYGSKKKHRGAGSRGGRGNSGQGKRAAQCNKPSVWKDTKRYGKHGFKRNVRALQIVCINIIDLERGLDNFGKAVKREGDIFAVDLDAIGCNKLLSRGNVTRKWKINTKFASPKAVEKVKAFGGVVVLEEKDGAA